ncbi:MAG: cell surface protein SprA, partial [Flavobacteriales bacterium]
MIFTKRPVLASFLVVLFLLGLPSFAQDSSSVHIYEAPSNVESGTEYDPNSGTYQEHNSIGNFNIGSGSIFNFDEYNAYRQQQMLENYWRKLARGSSSDSFKKDSKLNGITNQLTEGLIPDLKIDKEKIGKIFGPDLIDLSLRGSLELDFQVKNSYRGNLSIPKSRRTNTSFKMDNDIQVNADGKIGDKLNINTDYFTKALFNRRNVIDLKYEGEEDEIIKLVQLGNVNLPLPSSLITGSQDLFGVKTTWQFGPTRVTGVFSEQKSESQSFQIENGGQKNEFEIYADKYDDNRHYFVAPYFYNHYDEALKQMPYVASEIDITKMEVWVTNTRAKIEDARDILALTHLGDNINDIAAGEQVTGSADAIATPNNANNDLNPKALEDFDGDFRTFHQLNSATGNKGIKIIDDYEKVEKARKLSLNEYSYNPKLGFISLNQKLRSNEVLAVAFQYTYRGEVFQVGEFADQLISPNTLILKLLKPSVIDVEHPNWKLMMKNVYSLNAYQVNKKDFVLNILYKQPESGSKLRYIPEERLDSMQLIELMNLDNLNANGDLSKDGYFDFISNPILTIDAQKGKVYLPAVEPFGEFIKTKILEKNPALPVEVAESYMYPELYARTKSDAEQQPEKNRYLLKGSYKSEYGSEISLNAYNLQPGSVKLRQGSEQLSEGIDFIVDYSLGRVTIINEGKLNSGTPIDVSVESQSGFLQSKRFMGLRVDHTVNEHLMFGGSFLNMKQSPITNKINYGEEPINNSVWGIDGTYQKEAPFLTSLVN